jgi:plasmid maintenance system antidote protein VapI
MCFECREIRQDGGGTLVPVFSSCVDGACGKRGSSRKQLSDIVNCRAGISPEMAIRLDKAFGGGADTWYRLQSTWELAQALKNADQIKVERLSPAA